MRLGNYTKLILAFFWCSDLLCCCIFAQRLPEFDHQIIKVRTAYGNDGQPTLREAVAELCVGRSDSELRSLSVYPDNRIAIPSKWLRTKLEYKRLGGLGKATTGIQEEFSGFLQGRMFCEVPAWWMDRLFCRELNIDGDKNGDSTLRKIKSNCTFEEFSDLEISGTIQGQPFFLTPPPEIDFPEVDETASSLLVLDNRRAVLGLMGPGIESCLICFDRLTGEVMWKKNELPRYGFNWGIINRPPPEEIELRRTGQGDIAVFIYESLETKLYVIDPDDSSVDFRFSSLEVSLNEAGK
jgi:hypothetical protein